MRYLRRVLHNFQYNIFHVYRYFVRCFILCNSIDIEILFTITYGFMTQTHIDTGFDVVVFSVLSIFLPSLLAIRRNRGGLIRLKLVA